ncbi:hypothetical protein LTR94_035330, partial [Friedmanniomyces endolithicus]
SDRDPRRAGPDLRADGAERAEARAGRGGGVGARVPEAGQGGVQGAEDGLRHAEAAAERRLLGRREEADGDPADGPAGAVAADPGRDGFGPGHRRLAHRRRR